MKIRALVVVSAMLAITIGSLAGPGEAAPRANRPVSIVDFAFMPSRLTINVGDRVTWTNNGAAPHTSSSLAWDSGTLNPGETFTFTFNTSGRFRYRCNIHPEMRGLIQARP